MARSRSTALVLATVAVAAYLSLAPTFISAGAGPARVELDTRVAVATVAGLAPLALGEPAMAYDSVVAMLKSWLAGFTVIGLILGAALVAAIANPLTKRRQEVQAEVDAMRK